LTVYATLIAIHGDAAAWLTAVGGIGAFLATAALAGSGIALNIVHGIEIAGTEYAFGEGMQVRVLTPGERMQTRERWEPGPSAWPSVSLLSQNAGPPRRGPIGHASRVSSLSSSKRKNPTSPTKSARLRHIAGRLKLRLESEPPDGTTESNLD
jgi:hypothetical protein